ncbi:MAG: MATE family efflux transporter, partial [Myxococcota bacterium]
GRFGFPALGVIGAAWASLIASALGFAFILLFFAKGWALEATARVAAGQLRLAEWWRMLRFGIPNGLNFFLELAAFAIFINVVVADLGTSALAAMMVVFSVNSVSFMPAFGLSTAGAILTGQAIGAERKDEVPSVMYRTLAVTVTWQVAVGLSYLLAPAVIIGWFAPSDEGPSLVVIGTTMLSLSAAWQFFDAVAIVVGEALRAAGDTAWSMWARVVAAWVVFMPAAFYFVTYSNGGPVAAIGCVILYLSVLSIALYMRFQTGAWRRIDLTGLNL